MSRPLPDWKCGRLNSCMAVITSISAIFHRIVPKDPKFVQRPADRSHPAIINYVWIYNLAFLPLVVEITVLYCVFFDK
jgi:hypothetical protein